MSETRDPPVTGNTPSDDLREMIAENYREQQERPPAAEGTAAAPAGADAGQSPAAGEEAAPTDRGADGRFLSSSEEAEKIGALVGERPRPGEGEPAPAAADRAPSGPPKPPDHWSTEDKELFGSLSTDDDRAKFLRLNARREAGLTPRLQHAADLERAAAKGGWTERADHLERGYGEIEQMFEPWQPQLRAQGRVPKDIIKIWYEVERGLTNPQSQDEVIANIIAGYRANPENVMRHVNMRRGFAEQGGGGGPSNGNGIYRAQDPGQQPPAVQGGQTTVSDPVLAQRIDRLEAGHSQLAAGERGRLEAEWRANVSTAAEIYKKFADARDSAGNLLHPYLKEVEPQMHALAKLDRDQGKQAIDLDDLYDRATWGENRSTRELLLAERQESEARKAADERKAKADAARRAGSSVTGAPGPGAAPQEFGGPERSIRDEIRAQMDGGRR